MKRRKRDASCFLCEKAGELCQGDVPCTRCVRLGTPHMCWGKNQVVEEVPGGASSATKDEEEASAPVPQESASKERSAPVAMQAMEVSVEDDNEPEEVVKEQPREAPKPAPSQMKVEEAAETEKKQLQLQGPPRRGRGRPPKHKPIPGVDPNQANLNFYMLQEMKALRQQQRQMTEEMLALKMENLQLKDDYAQIRAAFSKPGIFPIQGSPLSNSPLSRSPSSPYGCVPEPPRVVYDLSGAPRVLTANQGFCDMLGYSMEEIIGASWTKFIHKDSLSRTMALLTNDYLREALHVQVIQCYQHKNGASFWTADSLTILHDGNNKPVSAVVSVQFLGTSEPQASQIEHTYIQHRNPLLLEHPDVVHPVNVAVADQRYMSDHFGGGSMMPQASVVEVTSPTSPPQSPYPGVPTFPVATPMGQYGGPPSPMYSDGGGSAHYAGNGSSTSSMFGGGSATASVSGFPGGEEEFMFSNPEMGSTASLAESPMGMEPEWDGMQFDFQNDDDGSFDSLGGMSPFSSVSGDHMSGQY